MIRSPEPFRCTGVGAGTAAAGLTGTAAGLGASALDAAGGGAGTGLGPVATPAWLPPRLIGWRETVAGFASTLSKGMGFSSVFSGGGWATRLELGLCRLGWSTLYPFLSSPWPQTTYLRHQVLSTSRRSHRSSTPPDSSFSSSVRILPDWGLWVLPWMHLASGPAGRLSQSWGPRPSLDLPPVSSPPP
jgi:hypothetical protein